MARVFGQLSFKPLECNQDVSPTKTYCGPRICEAATIEAFGFPTSVIISGNIPLDDGMLTVNWKL